MTKAKTTPRTGEKTPGEKAHCRHVAELCAQLLRHTAHLHGLTKTCRPLLEAAALLHDRPGDAKAIRKLRTGLTDEQGRTVARALELHSDQKAAERALAQVRANAGRKKSSAHPPEEPAALQVALRIAAILRIGAGLGHANGQDAQFIAAIDRGGSIALVLNGLPGIREAAKAAFKNAGLWNALMLKPVSSVTVYPPGEAPPREMRPSIPMAQAGRRILEVQFEQFLSRQYGIDSTGDIEYVHEMRVATRRFRAGLRAFRSAIDGSLLDLKAGTSLLAGELGNARDLDVFILFLNGYMAHAPKTHAGFVGELIAAQQQENRGHYQKLRRILKSAGHRSFSERAMRMLHAPPGSKGAFQPQGKTAEKPVWKKAPRIILKRLKQVTSHSGDLAGRSPAELHALRIACKKLRYTAEFFSDIYSGKLEEVRLPAEEMQALLGDVHDADVYTERIVRYCARQKSAPNVTAADALLSHMKQWQAEALQQASGVWRAFAERKTQRKIKKIIESPAKDERI